MELGTLIQYFKADTSDFDAGLARSDRNLKSFQNSSRSIIQDITGRFPLAGRASQALAGDLLHMADSGEKAVQKAQRLREQLRGLEDQALRVKNRFSDFNQTLKINFGGQIDTNFLKQFRQVEDYASRVEMLHSKGFSSDYMSKVERAAFQFTKLERDGGKALDLIAGKSSKVTQELSEVEKAAASASTGFGAMAGPLGIAVAGALALDAALIAVGGTLAKGTYSLVKSTNEYAGNLQDLAQKTGISVEMLSVLKLAAENSGSSIDGANSALGRYLKGVSDVNHGNTELEKKFKQAGFTAQDMKDAYKSSDDAIRILVQRIGSLSSEEDRLNALQKVGVRNGQDLNGIIREMNGNLADYEKTAKELGLVTTPEQAIEADKFNDTLHILGLEFKALGFQVGREFTPELTRDMELVGDAMKRAKGPVSEFAHLAVMELHGATVAVGILYDTVKNLPQAFREASYSPDLALIYAATDAVRDNLKPRKFDVGGELTGNVGKRVIGDEEDKSRESKAQRAARRALAIEEVGLQEQQRIYREKLEDEERLYRESQQTLSDYTSHRIAALKKLYEEEKAVFDKERALINASRLEQGEKDVRLRQLKEKEEAARSNYERQAGTDGQIQKDADRKEFENRQQHNAALLRIKEQHYQSLNQLEQRAAQQGLTTFVEAETAKYNRQLEIQKAQAEALTEARNRLKPETAGYKQLDDQIKAINDAQMDGQEEHFRNLAEARLADLQNAQRYAQGLRAIGAQIIDINQEVYALQTRALEDNSFYRSQAIERTRVLEVAQAQESLRRTAEDLKERKAILQAAIEEEKALAARLASQITVENREQLNKQIADIQASSEKKQAEITKTNELIVANEKVTAERIAEINRQAQEKILQKWREIASDITDVLADAIDAGAEKGGKGFFESLERSALDTIRKIERELLNSAIMTLLKPDAPHQGSQAGGVVGAITNKILGWLGLGPKDQQQGEDANTTAVASNTTATDKNTQAIYALTRAIQSGAFQPGGQQSAGISGGYWAGLANALIGSLGGGLSSGLSGGFGGGALSDGGGYGEVVGYSIAPPTMTPGHANGGSFGPNEMFPVGEQGEEMIYTGSQSGVVVPNHKLKGGGEQIVHKTYNLNFVLPPENRLPGPNQRMVVGQMLEHLKSAEN
ncbi:MAG TPA: hypothetical protein VGB17_06955 [Pyrinomonadaceae bacterium]